MATSESISALKRGGLSLFASLLRLHRHKLPGEIRDLGDRVLKQEFRQIWRFPNATAVQWTEFLSQWTRYHAMMKGQGDVFSTGPSAASRPHALSHTAPDLDPSGALDAATIDAMTPEQRLQLVRLHAEARKLGDRMTGQGAAGQAQGPGSGGSGSPGPKASPDHPGLM